MDFEGISPTNFMRLAYPNNKRTASQREICNLVSLNNAKILASKLGTVLCSRYERAELARNARLIAQ